MTENGQRSSSHRVLPSRFKKNSINIKFSKAKRQDIYKESYQSSPGPGMYESLQDKSFQSKIIKTQSGNKTPFRQTSERFRSKSQITPGPGMYLQESKKVTNFPKFEGSSKRLNFVDHEQKLNAYKPSPDKYSSTQFKSSSTHHFTMSKSAKLLQKCQNTLGPGQYDCDFKKFSSQRSFGKRSFSTSERRINFTNKNDSPCPTNYMMESSFQKALRLKRGFKNSRSLLNLSSHSIIPGPGSYQQNPEIKFRSTVNIKFSQEKRQFKETLINSSKYFQSGKYQKSSEQYEKFKFKTSQRNKFSKNTVTGIQTYRPKQLDKFYDIKDAQVRKVSSNFSIQKNLRKGLNMKIQESPNSTLYNPEEKLIRAQAINHKFGKSSRLEKIKGVNLGPGQYKGVGNQLNKTGTKFSKGRRQFTLSESKSSQYRISGKAFINNSTAGLS